MDSYDFMMRNGRRKYITSAISPVDDDDEQREESGINMRRRRSKSLSTPPVHVAQIHNKDKFYGPH